VFFRGAANRYKFDKGCVKIFFHRATTWSKIFFARAVRAQLHLIAAFARVCQIVSTRFPNDLLPPLYTAASTRKIGISDDQLVMCCRATARHRSIGVEV
jgi:hypothetical protein